MFEKLSIEHSNLLINACSSNNNLFKLLIEPLNFLNLSFNERYNILEAVIKKCENKPELIPILSTQLLNMLAYYNTKYSFKTGILSKVSFWLENLAENYNSTTNWCYPDGTSFEASKYCKLLGEDLYT
ncbi:hypothetical protein WSTR_02430 [Wolbachia endosymbiont of Laodelphax striatellus]|nr:hypothetical protein WSTR_02430 [Wolbachia endosymbiont of Laodelphax striatellus]